MATERINCWDFKPSEKHNLGKCAQRVAEELSARTSITVAQAFDVLEELAAEFPALIMIKDR